MKHLWYLLLIVVLLFPGTLLAAEELKVVSATPQGDLNSLTDAGAITVTFDRAVVALSGVQKDQKDGPLVIAPAISGVYRWMGTSTLSFVPEKALDSATRYTVQVKADLLTAVGGEVLAKDYNFSFVTPRPLVDDNGVYPYQEQQQIALDQPLFVRFNQPVDVAKAAKFISLKGAKGADVPIQVTVPDENDVKQNYIYWLDSLENVKDVVLKITPQQKLAIETTYTLRLRSGLPGKVGKLGMKQTYESKFSTYNNFRIDAINSGSTYCGEQYFPEAGIEIVLSNPVNRDALMQHLHISPEVKFPEEESYETQDLYLMPNFQPNTEYTVTIDGELQDKYGQALSKPFEQTFTTTDYAAYLEMPTGRMISEAYLGTRFPVKIMNVQNAPLRLKAYRTPEEVLKAVKAASSEGLAIEDADIDREYHPDIVQNKIATMPFDLKEALHEDENTGVIGLSMDYTSCTEETRTNTALIFLTNISATAKFSADNSLFWVTQLKDSSAVQGAEVELYDENQQFLWKGATDADGFAQSPGWKELGLKATDSWEQPWIFAIVRSGDDQVVIHSRDGTGIWPYRFNIDYQPNTEHLPTDGYLFTERGIYRPGDDVRIVGLIRQKQHGELAVPQSLEVEVQISNSEGQELYKKKHKLSDFGSFHLPFKLSQNAKIGTYQIKCTFPFPETLDLPKDQLEWVSNSVYGDFKVEMYRPVEFEVKIALDKDQYVKGDPLDGSMAATYLFGGPVRNVPVEWNLNRSPYSFYPEAPQLAGYAFNAADERSYEHVADQKGQMSDNGEFGFDYTIKDNVYGSFYYSLEATVTDVNERMVSGRKQVIVHGGEYYIGLKPQSFFADTAKEFAIDTIAVTPDEKLAAGKSYQIQIKRIWWESVQRAGNGGRLSWETEQKEEVVKEFPVESAAEPVTLTVTFDKVGYYKVEAKGADSRGNEIRSEDYFYAVGSGYAAWMRSDDDYVEIVSEKNQYQPGDVAKVLVKSPYETAQALVTVEREGILERWVETIEGSADTIEIPIKPEYIPNVYIGVILIQGRVADNKIEDELDLGKPGFKIGYTGVKVNPAERQLKVEITTNQEEYRPATQVEMQLHVTDQQGQGQEAEVIVSVVDVGVLNLIGYNTPNPFDYFYRIRPLAVLTSELRNSIVGQRNYSEKGERKSSDGIDMKAMMAMIQLREKFKATAYHNPEVRTDANGNATVRFTLPDNLTAFRIMATAHTKQAFFGAGDKRITVNKKLMLTPSLPSFLRIGDTINAGVLAHNRTEKDGDAAIQAETDGVALASDNLQTLTLPKGDKKEALFAYKAEKEQPATFIFKGKLEDETDGVKVTLPILLHRLPLTTALFGNTSENSYREWLTLPDDATPGWGDVKFSLASTIFTDIKGGVDFLFGYPYGCLEQKISRILPIILAEDLIKAFKLEVFKDDDYRAVVQTTLDEFSAYQLDNGGFGYWKPPYEASPFVSAYAMFTLAMAKANGYTVDVGMEQKGVEYLENVLKGQNERATVYRYNELAWNATDAMILYTLSYYGKYQPAYATRLYDVRDRLPIFGKALLLKAVQHGKGDKLIKKTLTDELMNSARLDARTAHFEDNNDPGLLWIHNSNVRTTAAVAQALMEVYGASKTNASFIPKAIEWLMRERKQNVYWRTTQENLFVFWTLSTYLKTFEATAPDFTGKVLLNGEEIFAELFQGRTTKVAEKSLPLDRLTAGQKTPVDFVKDKDGRLYYTAVMTYLPSGEPEAIDYGIAVQKKMTIVKGKGKESGAFTRGDLVKVELTITTPSDRLFVFVDDPLPAGFKAINFGLQTTDQSLQQFIEEKSGNESPFVSSEFKDDRVVFYAEYLGQGVHTVSYLASAEHSGHFNIPPTFSAEMYTPEVFGQTGASVLDIQ